MTRLSDVVGQRVVDAIHSPASTYAGGTVSMFSGVGTLLDPHNLIFMAGTFGGLVFAWLTYRSRRRKDDALIRLRQRDSDALVEFLQSRPVSMNDVDDAPEVVQRAMHAMKDDYTFNGNGNRTEDK